MPLGKNIPRSIGGNIFKIKLLHYGGKHWAGPWHDTILKKRQKEAKIERRREVELARIEAEAARLKAELAAKKARELAAKKEGNSRPGRQGSSQQKG